MILREVLTSFYILASIFYSTPKVPQTLVPDLAGYRFAFLTLIPGKNIKINLTNK